MLRDKGISVGRRAAKDRMTAMNSLKNQMKGFTIKELIVVIILIILFYFGLIKGAEVVSKWKTILWGILPLVCGIVTGSLFVLSFILLWLGVGALLEKRKHIDHKDGQERKKENGGGKLRDEGGKKMNNESANGGQVANDECRMKGKIKNKNWSQGYARLGVGAEP